jgi:enamine deaminase RidA (YjgF/YER057c/UK114 family)
MRILALLVLASLASETAWSLQRNKEEEEETQVLELPKELPAAVTAETSRLVFYVSPLSAKGLLSQQTRNALKGVIRAKRGGTVVKLRAFVAGSGDLRRVRDLISDTFSKRREPLPALSLVQVGALPMTGAQVQLESIAVARKPVNPHGLAFISGQGALGRQPLDPVLPLAQQSLAGLRAAVRAAGAGPADVLRVSCFLSSLEGLAAVRNLFAAEYRSAALTFLQVQRAPVRAVAECEAVARLRAAPGSALRLLNPDGMSRSPHFSQIALVGAPAVVLTGTQVSFGYQEADARLAFQRLEKVLEQAGGSLKDLAFSGIYPLSGGIAEQVRRVRFEFYDKARPPASTLLEFQGLPSMDAGFAVDVVAIKN